MTTTKEIENVTWPMSCAGRPSGIAVYRLVNTMNNALPMTISGVASGNSIKEFDARLVRPRHLVRPTAIAAPIGVAMSSVRTPSVRLLVRASRSDGSCATDEN
jgi:hypothetical protein